MPAGTKLKLPEAFWSRVDQRAGPRGCWLWIGSLDGHGYGKLTKGYIAAHRYSFELAHGPIPKGLCVLHRCDRPRCVNPYHLWLGTLADNMRDRAQKKRHRFGENEPNAKLTTAEVLEIRRLKDRPELSYREIGRRFNVKRQTVQCIVLEKTWRHLL